MLHYVLQNITIGAGIQFDPNCFRPISINLHLCPSFLCLVMKDLLVATERYQKKTYKILKINNNKNKKGLKKNKNHSCAWWSNTCSLRLRFNILLRQILKCTAKYWKMKLKSKKTENTELMMSLYLLYILQTNDLSKMYENDQIYELRR